MESVTSPSLSPARSPTMPPRRARRRGPGSGCPPQPGADPRELDRAWAAVAIGTKECGLAVAVVRSSRRDWQTFEESCLSAKGGC